MVETEKVNKLFPNIPTVNITELNKQIHAWAKLVFEKNHCSLTNPNTKKNWMGIKWLQQKAKDCNKKAKLQKKENHARIYWDGKTKTKQQISLTIKLEEIN